MTIKYYERLTRTINKPITVFALVLCMLDNNNMLITGLPPLPVETSTPGNNWRGFSLVPRHCASAPRSLCIRGLHMAR